MSSQENPAAQDYAINAEAPTQPQLKNLTEREKQILNLLADGLTMQDIAYKLKLSSHTIPTHCKNIYRKLAVHNGRSAVVKALKENLI